MSIAENTPPSVSPQPSDDARIAASIDNWKRKLLDLSKRNRALNFRLTRVSTVAMADEQPAEVFRRLYIQGKPMRFRAAEVAAADSSSTDGDGETGTAALDEIVASPDAPAQPPSGGGM